MSTHEQAPAPEPARKTSFDQADRERIRAALFSYMEENRIGVPTLIAHMAKAIKRDRRYIPQKTLQRFLAGDMRTNDASVSIFHEFHAFCLQRGISSQSFPSLSGSFSGRRRKPTLPRPRRSLLVCSGPI